MTVASTLQWIAVDGTLTSLSDSSLQTYYAEGPAPAVGQYGLPVTIISHAVPLMSGVREQWIQIAANDIRFPLRVFGGASGDPAQLLQNIRALSEAMRPTRGVGILQHTAADGVVRQLFCRETGRFRTLAANGPGWASFGMIFSAADPYWYDSGFTTLTFSPSGGVPFYPVGTVQAPSLPSLATATTGGTVLAGTYKVVTSYTNSLGETIGSAQATITTTGSTSTITINSPAAMLGATGWYAYVSQAGGSTLTRQQAVGSPTAVGTNLVLTAPPTSSGATAPATNTAAGSPASELHLSVGGVSSAFTVTNSGQDVAWPIWTIMGPGTNPIITNNTTGQVLTVAITLTNGQVLTIDTRPLFLNVYREDGSNQWAAISDVSQLWPLVTGVNNVALSMSGTTSASQLTLQYKQVYEGV